MIGIHCSIRTQAGQLQVRLQAGGKAQTEIEELYAQTLRQAITTALEVANRKAQEIQAKLEAAPAQPLSADAVVLDANFRPEAQAAGDAEEKAASPAAIPPCFSPRPPVFGEFLDGLRKEFALAVRAEKEKPEPNDDTIVALQAAAAMVAEYAKTFMQALVDAAKARQQAGGEPHGKN